MTRALDAVIVASAALLLLIAGFGGLDVQIGPLSIRARDWVRPALALAAALTGWAILHVAARPGGRPQVREALSPAAAVEQLAARGLLALIVAAGLAYAHLHVRVAGGLDSYGYVSAATMIAAGRLHEPQPLAAVLPFAGALNAATPLGQVPASDGRSSVPRFPLGLPIVMAAFAALHSSGPYYAPLVLGYAAIVLVFLIVRAAADPVTGLFAAALLAVEPVFAVAAIYPMSDVPAAFWLLAAIWASYSNRKAESAGWSAASGLFAGMAVLTRPVLLPAALVFVLAHIGRGPSRCLVARASTVGVSLLMLLWINVVLYGSVTISGYGTYSHMFEVSPSRVSAVIANFATWIAHSHTAPVWLAWPAALVVLRRDRRAWELSAVAAAAALPYLFYLVFDNWASLRFLLPTIVLALVVTASALKEVATPAGAGRWWPPAVFLAVALACSVAAHQFVIREGVALGRIEEEKYPLVGAWFREHTGERAVVLSSLHSGPIRLYSGRQTLRWDEIPETALDATIGALVGQGYEPYLALDTPSEPPLFAERFESQSADPEPVARVRVVNIYKFVPLRR